MKNLISLSIVGAMLVLSACGDQPGERALTGGGIGAGAGAVVGAATGGSVAGGALLGGAAGAATGALTNSHQIDLNR